MMRIKPETDLATIVLLGKFNPSIFTPAWFGWNKLIPAGVANKVNLQICHPQFTAFDAGWFTLEVRSDLFRLSTAQPFFINLCDLAVRIFREKLPHTPLTALGINKEIQYCVKNLDERMKLGRKLAPIEPWGDWGREIEHNEIASGMKVLTMSQMKPKVTGRSPNCSMNVTVSPFDRFEDGRIGINVSTNDHYAIENENSQTATSEIINLLQTNFERSVKQSDRIINHIMSLVETEN